MGSRKTWPHRRVARSASPAAQRKREARVVDFALPTVFDDYVTRIAAWENRSRGAVYRAIVVLGLRAYEELARRTLCAPNPISRYATPSPAPELLLIDEATAAELRERLAELDAPVREAMRLDERTSLSQAVARTYVEPVLTDGTDLEAIDLGFEEAER